MQRIQTIQTVDTPTDSPLFLQTDIAECFDYDGRQVCIKDLVKLQDLQDRQQQPLENNVEQGTLGNSRPNIMPSVADQGCCSAANPYVPYNVAPVVLVFDIFLPGVGTIIAAYFDPSGCNCKTITCGIFQMLLTIILVGWIWSIV